MEPVIRLQRRRKKCAQDRNCPWKPQALANGGIRPSWGMLRKILSSRASTSGPSMRRAAGLGDYQSGPVLYRPPLHSTPVPNTVWRAETAGTEYYTSQLAGFAQGPPWFWRWFGAQSRRIICSQNWKQGGIRAKVMFLIETCPHIDY